MFTGVEFTMKRKIFQTVLCASVFCSVALSLSAPGQVKSDKEHDGLLGKVHIIKTEVAKISIVSGTPTEGKRELQRTETYDVKGNLTERVSIHSTTGLATLESKDGKASSRQVFIHGKNGDRVEYSYPSTGRSNIQLNWGGRGDGSLQIIWFLKFDANGNRILEEVSRSDGTPMYKNVYSYDSAGRKAEVVHSYRDKSRRTRSVYSYDDKGSVSEMASYEADGSLKEKLRYSYEYDQIGNWVRRVSSRAMSKDGKELFEAVEISYRTITYDQ